MTRQEFKNLCESKIVLLDGATGSNLQKCGFGAGESPEQWILKNPAVLTKLQREYIRAGSDIIYAPTFTANSVKLSEFGLDKDIERINTDLVALSRQAVSEENLSRPVFVAGDLTMTGKVLRLSAICCLRN